MAPQHTPRIGRGPGLRARAPYHPASFEKIAASPRLTGGAIATGAPFLHTITFSEAGWADVGRAVLQVSLRAAVANVASTDLNPITQIRAINFNNTSIYIRGRNAPISYPASIFSAIRQQARMLGLPRYLWVEPSDILTLTGQFTLGGVTADSLFAVPYVPKVWRNKVDTTLGAGNWLDSEAGEASPQTAVVDGALTPVAITMQSPGPVDIARLVAQSAFAAPVANFPAESTLPQLGIQQLILSGPSYNIITGQGAAEAPATMFDPTRGNSWARLGQWDAVPGDTLTAQVLSRTGVNVAVTLGVPQYPSSNSGDGGGGSYDRAAACAC